MKSIKIASIILISVSTIVFFSSSVSAQSLPSIPQLTKPLSQMSVPELQAKIQEIASAIQQLQAMLNQMIGASNLSGIPLSFTFNTNLKQGQCNQDVKYLQIYLNSNPNTVVSLTGPGSKGQETICFGLKTKLALAKYQEQYK